LSIQNISGISNCVYLEQQVAK